jgi:hypothetical protein
MQIKAEHRLRLNRIAERFRGFATYAAAGGSESYQKLAVGIAASPKLLEFIASFPVERRHPNLFLAAVRHLRGIPENPDHLLEVVQQDAEAIRGVMMSRMVQTNEPARCSLLLPVLSRLPQPLAIVEVGASAGLCLLPDRYGYDYGFARIDPPASLHDRAPVFACEVTGAVPLPHELPRIVWRVGLDRNPIDVRSDDDMAWLETLVWPGMHDRARWLRGAIDVARLDPPEIVKGDLVTDLGPLLAKAPKDATLVVFHTAVLEYVTPESRRDDFRKIVRSSGAVWISNEAPRVFPRLTGDIPPRSPRGRFVTMLDGVPVAWTGPHGESIDWFAGQ